MLLWSAIGCVATVALVAAAIGGWAAANRLVVAEQDRDRAEIITVALPDYAPGATVRMPDVRGLSRADAEQALVDAGIPADLISVDSRSAAGPAGVVIQQSPVFGTQNPATSRITISEPAVIPKVDGRPAAEVITELQNLGARVEQVRAFVPGVAAGTVASVSPAPGENVPQQVKVTIGDTASERALGDLSTAQGSAYASSDVIHDGKTYSSAIELSTNSTMRSVAWNFGAKVTLFEGSLALEDDYRDGFAATVVVRGDGVELARQTVIGVAPVPFSWDVQGVTTLVIEVTRIGDTSGSVMLLEPTLLGSSSTLSLLK